MWKRRPWRKDQTGRYRQQQTGYGPDTCEPLAGTLAYLKGNTQTLKTIKAHPGDIQLTY